MTAATEARPIFFGDSQALFGWYHAPHGSASRDCAVVLCSPIGHEYMCSHRAFRHLAERLAAAGFATIRFDYYGTGDSLGGPNEDGLVQRWQDNIGNAIDEVRARSGMQRVVVVGLRIGATLAALSTARRDDVDAVVLWSPSLNGRSYVREVMMLGQATKGATQDTASNDGSVEAAGFLLSRSTCTDLSAIKLAQMAPVPIARALLLSRDDLPQDADVAFAEHLRQHHVAVTQQAFSGYSAFMVAPVKSVLPVGALGAIVAWLETTYPASIMLEDAAPPSSAGASSMRTHTIGASPIREEAVRFGPSLFGMLTEPAQRDGRRPAIILMNTGGDHHVGPHRMYAPLVRRWGVMGFTTLRIDISGLGESPARPGQSEAVAYPPNALDDLHAALEYMRTRGIDRVIVMGVCSGAYYSVHAARAGIPIAGNIAVNPPLYWSPGRPLEEDTYWTQYESKRVGRALFSPAKWVRLFSGKVDFRATLRLLFEQSRNLSRATVSIVQQTAKRHTTGNDADNLLTLFPEEVDTLLTFSGDDLGLKYLEGQNDRDLRKLRERRNFQFEVIAGADHTFMPIRWQNRLAELLTTYLVERYNPDQ